MKIESYKVRGETRYRFRASLGRIDGKEKKIRRSGFETREEAKEAYLQIAANSRKYNVQLRTVQYVYDLWINTYALGVKDSTLRHVQQMFRDHILPEMGSMPIQKIDTPYLQQYVNEQIGKAVKANERIVYLKRLFRFAYQQGIITTNPLERVSVPKVKKPENIAYNYYTKDELKKFLDLAREKLSPMWYAFFRLLAYTGLRRGEALALTWDDLDEEKHTLTIHRTLTRNGDGAYISDTPKTSKSNRTILIDQETLTLLLALDHDSDYIFHNSKGSFITQSQPVRQIHRVVDGTDLHYISPHGFRHTHCSLLFSAGVSIPEVQDRLGHTDVQTTINIYNHVYEQDRSKALSRFIQYMKAGEK